MPTSLHVCCIAARSMSPELASMSVMSRLRTACRNLSSSCFAGVYASNRSPWPSLLIPMAPASWGLPLNATIAAVSTILFMAALGRVPVGSRRRFFLPMPGTFMAGIILKILPMSSYAHFGASKVARVSPFWHSMIDMTPESSTSGASQNKAKMGRPRLNKVRCQLHLDVEEHLALQMVALHDKRTMSSLVGEWATREGRRRQWSNRAFRLPRKITNTVEKLAHRDIARDEEVLPLMAEDVYDKPWYGPLVYRFWQAHRKLAGWWWRLLSWSPARGLRGKRPPEGR